jgi:DNA-binding response OmpR family regulator
MEHVTQQQSAVPAARAVEKNNPRLVVIEDDKFLRDLIVRKLTSEGFVVQEAESGEEGLKVLQADPPQLLLLDILLPGMSGYDVLEAMRKDEKLKGVPVVMLSNLGQKEEVERAQYLGAKDFLIKAKYTPGEIVTRVKEILDELYM